MDRFTTYKDGWRVLGDVAYVDDALAIRGEAVDRLAAYEDTRLTPEEVEQIKGECFGWKCDAEKYKTAEEDG